MRKWLQDPKVVAGLGLFALLYMVFTFWPKQTPRVASRSVEQSTLIALPIQSQLPVEQPSSKAIYTEDSVNVGGLDSIGWKRRSNRDPFMAEKRKGLMAYWVLRQEAPLERPRVAIAKKKRAPIKYSLQAVAIGPAGKLALVSGKWYSEGVPKGNLVFERITSDSVVFKIGARPRTLRFSTTR